MKIWHLQTDTPRRPHRVSPGDSVQIQVGTWPIEPGQSVWASLQMTGRGGASPARVLKARWVHNQGPNSYWELELGRFERGDRVRYQIFGESRGAETTTGPEAGFSVGPKLHLALLWHHHQPLYRELDAPTPRGCYRHPWVRLHALRGYYSMAALLAPHRRVRATVNLTPVLLWQIQDYLEGGATDRALELTLKPTSKLTRAERAELLARFFDAHEQNQILIHPRYAELYAQRAAGHEFSTQDLRDLKMWFSLCWFGVEMREGDVPLPTGEVVSVHRFVAQGRGFRERDLEELVAEQYKVLRAVVPVHRRLQDEGRIEVSTTPFYHPIVPLLVDTDQATLDRSGTWLPRRFAHPEDADAQVQRAMHYYEKLFGRAPRGMWPAEGAVSQASIPVFAKHGVRWLATDRGVLERSGKWGYPVDDPDVVCQPYRAREGSHELSVFFRDTALSDAIGFSYQHEPDGALAARDLVTQIEERFARRLTGDTDRVLTLALDGENPWGGYARDGRPFLDELYRLLDTHREIETVTFGEYLDGDAEHGVVAHPPDSQPRVHELFTGSWADEPGSAAGIDLGTWIGEEEENRAWELLGRAREALTRAGRTPENAPAAFEALYAAEGSDWFWWYGSDQESGRDEEFDALFRAHLRTAYLRAELEPPGELDVAIVPALVPWSFSDDVARLERGSRLAVRTECPGVVSYQVDDGPDQLQPVAPAGGVMPGLHRHQAVLGPFGSGQHRLRLRFHCQEAGCDRESPACSGVEQVVQLVGVTVWPEAPRP